MKAILNWSGGKDSMLTLHKVKSEGLFDVKYLLTTFTDEHRVSMHGVKQELIEAQALSLGIPLLPVILPVNPSNLEYENVMNRTYSFLKSEEISHSLFGDIHLEDLRSYREEQVNSTGLTAAFPLWASDPQDLINEFIFNGYKAVTVCVDSSKLHFSFCGRELNRSFIDDLPENVDRSGENGEFHTFVYDGLLFKDKIELDKKESYSKSYSMSDSVDKNKFYFSEFELKSNPEN